MSVVDTLAPTTWLLMGHKGGDNAQLSALAGALGWPYETRHFTYRPTELITNRLLGTTLAGIVPERSSPLAPPWPELILTAGRRNEPVARWIRARSGGTTKIVHLGRPWAPLEAFDLIVTTPQYDLPKRPNVLEIEAPLHHLDAQTLAAHAATVRSSVHMKPPFVVVLLGGDAGTYRLDRENARLLGYHASALAAAMEGSLLATSSRRTPPRSLNAFRAAMNSPAQIFEWSASVPSPYLGLLGLADAIVVTSDSVSMLTEAIGTRKPVFVFDLAKGIGSHRPAFPGAGPIEPAGVLERLQELRWRQVVNRVGDAVAPKRMVRDLRRIAERQVNAGRAAWLGQPLPTGPHTDPLDDLYLAADRVRGLFAS